MNTFQLKPEFITSDIRVHRPWKQQFQVSTDNMEARHQLWFSKSDLTGKRVLDLGCCVAATGAWVLDHGASHYTGVDIQQDFLKKSQENLSKYYDTARWTIVNSSIEEYLENCQDQFDIVIAAGVLTSCFDYFSAVKRMSQISKEIIIENVHPYRGFKEMFPNKTHEELHEIWQTLELVSYESNGQALDTGYASVMYDSSRPSMAAFQKIFRYLGWDTDFEINKSAQQQLPHMYDFDSQSYGIRFILKITPTIKSAFDFIDSVKHKDTFSYQIKKWQ